MSVSEETDFGDDPAFLEMTEHNFSTSLVGSAFRLHLGVGCIHWWSVHDLDGIHSIYFYAFQPFSVAVAVLSVRSASLLSTLKLTGLLAGYNC